MSNYTTTAAAVATEAADTLVSTCVTCGQQREHPLDEPLDFECANPDCGGWVFSARLAEKAYRRVPQADRELLAYCDLVEAVGVPLTVDERAALRWLAVFEGKAAIVAELFHRARREASDE